MTLRIKKVEGTADDYTCIDGWTNYWRLYGDGFLQNNISYTKEQAGKLMPPRIMDSNGVIKKENLLKETSLKTDHLFYEKDVKGCYVKTTEILTLNGLETFNNNENYSKKEGIIFASDKDILHISVFGVSTTMGRYEMSANDITNDPKTGWTDEENSRWKNHRPVIAINYNVKNDLRDKITKANYHKEDITDKTKAQNLYDKIQTMFDKYLYYGFLK